MPLETPSRQSAAYESVFSRAVRPQKPTLPPNIPNKRSPVEQENNQEHEAATYAVKKLNVTQGSDRKALVNVVETLKGLSRDSTQSGLVALRRCSPWTVMTRLGVLTQSSQDLILCSSKESFGDLLFIQEVNKERGEKEFKILSEISHSNIIKVRQAFENNDRVFLGFEYFRHTLQELVCVHLPLEERHIRTISRSVSRKRVANRSKMD